LTIIDATAWEKAKLFRKLDLELVQMFYWCRDPDLARRIGAATALEVRATGIQYTFAPCVAVRLLHWVCLMKLYSKWE
jgi:hypothetical protein